MKLNFFSKELQASVKKCTADIKELQATIKELQADKKKATEELIRQRQIIERLVALLVKEE